MNVPVVPVYTAAVTHVGGRKTNEDAIYTSKGIETPQLASRGHLCIVADGTGGQEGGQTASAMAAAIVGERYYDDSTADLEQSMRTAVQTAHEALYELAGKVSTWAKMSTTIVAAVAKDDQLYIAHVGDSRAYLIREGTARLLTRDHVWLEDDENYGSLMRWLGGGRATVEVDTTKIVLKEGDKVLLCSDGLTNVADREDLQGVVAKLSPQAATEQLIELANRRGTSDNVSAAVIQYGGQAPKAKRPAWVLPTVIISVLVFVALGVWAALFLRDPVDAVDAGTVDGTATPTLASQIEGVTVATSTATPMLVATADLDSDKAPTSTPRPETPTPTPRPTLVRQQPTEVTLPTQPPATEPTTPPTTEATPTEPPPPPPITPPDTRPGGM